MLEAGPEWPGFRPSKVNWICQYFPSKSPSLGSHILLSAANRTVLKQRVVEGIAWGPM